MITITYNYIDSDYEFKTEVFMADDFGIIENLDMISIHEEYKGKTTYIPSDLIFKIEVM